MRLSAAQLIDHLVARNALGEERAIPRARIAEDLGVQIRRVRGAAEEARRAGNFVCYSTSSNGGIYLANSDAEMWAILTRVRRECLRRLEQYSALKRKMIDQNQRFLFPATPDEVFRNGK